MDSEEVSLTKKTLVAFNYSVKAFQLIGSSPFLLNPSTRTFSLNTSKAHSIYSVIDRVLTLFSCIVVSYAAYIALSNALVAWSLAIAMLQVAILNSCNLLTDETMQKYAKDIVELLNGLRIYMNHINRNYEKNKYNEYAFISSTYSQGNMFLLTWKGKWK